MGCFLGNSRTDEEHEEQQEKTRERERERLRENVKCLRKLAQTEGKGKGADARMHACTLAHVPKTEDPQIADRATKVAKRTVKTHAAY